MTRGPSVTPKGTPDSDTDTQHQGPSPTCLALFPPHPQTPVGDSQPKVQMLRCPLLLVLGDANWTYGMM